MDKYLKLTHELFKNLAVIPAPSGQEDLRAEFCLKKLKQFGFDRAYIDQAKNVVVEVLAPNSNEWVVFEAHTDVVFPDLTPLPLTEDDENYYNPGCGDDTICLCILMSALIRLKDLNKKPKINILVVFNSCEEGLGNLKGTKEIMQRYGKSVKEFITFDGRYSNLVNVSVGSHRYKVTVKTSGGHSYNSFGATSAMQVLAKGITDIYKIPLPKNGKTTYNVGVVSAGTSVNTIPQCAEMLCEYRSDVHENLAYMKERFFEIFDDMKKFATVQIEIVGERPSMKDVDMANQDKLTNLCKHVQEVVTGLDVKLCSGSTDCNIPHSLGIPAVCVGVYDGGGAHTREEWVQKSSITKGLQIANILLENYCE